MERCNLCQDIPKYIKEDFPLVRGIDRQEKIVEAVWYAGKAGECFKHRIICVPLKQAEDKIHDQTE